MMMINLMMAIMMTMRIVNGVVLCRLLVCKYNRHDDVLFWS
jgi:hypothetical protein